MSATESRSPPATSGAANRVRRRTAKTAASTTRKVTRFRVELRTPEGVHVVGCGEDEFIWNAAAQSGLKLPSICHQGRCLTCAARLIEGQFDQSAASSYFEADREAGFVLLCTARPRSDV